MSKLGSSTSCRTRGRCRPFARLVSSQASDIGGQVFLSESSNYGWDQFGAGGVILATKLATPTWPPARSAQLATKLVIDVPANSKTPISHQSIQLINSRLFPLAGLCSQINKYLSPFLEGQCTEPLDELTERMAERHNFTFKAISTIGFAGAEGLDAEHMLVRLI